MTSDEAIRLVRMHVERQFPKTCSTCGRVFRTLGEYLCATNHIGAPVSYDANAGDFLPRRPLGTFSLANCRCGTTLSIGSDGMRLVTLWRLMFWAKRETRRRGIDLRTLLVHVRDEIDRQALAGSGPTQSGSRPKAEAYGRSDRAGSTGMDAGRGKR